MRRIVRVLPVIAIVAMLVAGSVAQAVSRISDDGFTLSIMAANCQRIPTAHPFQGGDCVPARGAVIVVTTESGELIATCIARAEDNPSWPVAGCSVSVPYNSTVIVTEDVTSIPAGYAPTFNPQRWDIPAGPPEGEFGGPVFINLPQVTLATPAGSGTSAATPPPIATPTSGAPSVCLDSTFPTPELDPSLNMPGYIAVYMDGVLFVHWIQLDGSIVGTLYQTTPDHENPSGYNSESFDFTGAISGNQIVLTVSLGLGFTNTLTGVLSEDTLTLYFTNDSGLPETATLRRGTLAEYDQAVRRLRQKTAQAEACGQAIRATATARAERAEATASSIAAQQNAVYVANAVLDRALSRLDDDVGRLADSTDLESTITSYADDLAKMQDDEQAMREDAAEPLDCYRLWVVQYDLSLLEYDLALIEYNRSVLDYYVGIVSDHITTVEQDIKDVQEAFDALKSAAARNTTGEPRPAYGQDDVDQAVRAAQEQINMSKASIESAEQQASEYEKRATRLLQEAQDFVASLTCTG